MEKLVVPQGEFQLARYPRQEKEQLRAWDAADEYLLRYLGDEGLPCEEGNILILDDRFGALSVALVGFCPQVISDSFLAHRAIAENLRVNGRCEEDVRLLHSLQEPEGEADLVLFRVPKNLAFLEDLLYRLRPHLRADTRVVGAGMVRDIHRSTLALCERIVGSTRTSLARKKARLIFCDVDVERDSGVSPHPMRYRLEGTEHGLLNHANLFSRERLDIGTRLLLAQVPASEEARCIVDLGCGNGVVGLVAAERNPAAELLFVDESFMAVESARANFHGVFGDARKGRFEVGDGLEGQARNSVDLVLLNPPFHRQRAVDDAVPWRLFHQSRAALRRGGEIRVVGNRHLGYHVKLKRLFGNCETIASDRKFVVVRAVKR